MPVDPPLRAGACGAGACAWARVSAAPRKSWSGCWGVCVFVCLPRFCPATPGWGVPCVCVCLGWTFGCALPLLAGVLGCVCVFVCVLRLYLATPGWGVRSGCVCPGLGCGYAPPFPAGVLGCVCVCVRAPLVPRHSCPGFAVRVCVLVLGFRLRPATPGWSVGVCVCLCACSACTPPFLAGWYVCVGVWVSPALCFFQVWVLGRVASCVRRVRFSPPSGGAVRGVGVCGSCRGWGLFRPSPFVFFSFPGCRGGVWCLSLSCRGFVVSAAACPGLGTLDLRPPFPSHLGCAYGLFFLPISAPVGCV